MKKRNLDVNKSCEKMIQIVISLQIEPHIVVESINKWIQASVEKFNFIGVK